LQQQKPDFSWKRSNRDLKATHSVMLAIPTDLCEKKPNDYGHLIFIPKFPIAKVIFSGIY
jgi:hypothetical protein